MPRYYESMREPRPLRAIIRLLRPITFGVLVLALGCADSASESNRGATDVAYADAVEKLSDFVRHELEDKGIPAISVALVDDQDLVWAAREGLTENTNPRKATCPPLSGSGRVPNTVAS